MMATGEALDPLPMEMVKTLDPHYSNILLNSAALVNSKAEAVSAAKVVGLAKRSKTWDAVNIIIPHRKLSVLSPPLSGLWSVQWLYWLFMPFLLMQICETLIVSPLLCPPKDHQVKFR